MKQVLIPLIEINIRSKPEMKEAAMYEMESFLLYIRKHSERIYKHINSDEPNDKPLKMIAPCKNFTFHYTVNHDGTSVIDAVLKTSVSRLLESGFLLTKMKDEFGYVYFLKSDHGYKIGCTSKLDQRMKQFGVQLPFKFSVDSFVRCRDYGKLEAFLHRLLKHKRLNGEWFELTYADFVDIDIILNNKRLKREQYP